MDHAARAKRPRLAIFLTGACIGLALLPGHLTDWLAFDRQAILDGEVWRLWTGHLVHFSLQQALLDIAALATVLYIAERELGARVAALAMLLGAAMISLLLLAAAPGMQIYEGASGLSMVLGTAAAIQLWHRSPRSHTVLVLMAGAVIGKLLLDVSGSCPTCSSVPAGVSVAWQAHAAGLAIGGLMGWRVRATPSQQSGSEGTSCNRW